MGAMNRPWWISAALAWAGVVAVVALVNCWVIYSAGEEVLAEPSPDPAASSTTTTTADPTDPEDDPAGTRTPTPRPTEPETSAPTPTSPATTIAPETTPPPPPSGDPTTEAAPVRRSSSWQGTAGIVRVSCTGSSLRLDGATPADGWEVDTNTRHSGSELEVRFRSSDGDRETEVLARCVGGTPDFRVESD